MAKQNQRQNARQEARQAAQAGTFGQSNVQAMREAGVRPQAIQNIREVARQAPATAQAPAAAPSSGINIGYGVTNTGTPGGYSMPGGTDPRTGQPIAASQASNIFKLNIPFSTAGVTDFFGNPMNNSDTGFQVVGDGINWQDPANAGLLSQYTSPEAINRLININWAMSSANPNRDANMAAFIDSGHAESLITGRPPTALPEGFTGLYNPAMTGLITPWSQQYAAANSGAGGGTGGMSNAIPGGGGGAGGAGGRGSARSMGNASNLGQSIRAAGAGGISKSELSKMMEGSGRSGSETIQRLDQINRSLKDKGRTGISLNSGAANMLINQASKRPTSIFDPVGFGTGRIGTTLQGMVGDPGSRGVTIKGQTSGARPATKPKLMLGGTAIRPGGRETVRGFGKQFTPKTAAPVDTTPVSASTTTTGGDGGGMDMGGGGMGESFTAPETTTAATTPSTFGMGADLSSWATGFRRRQSSRKGAGPRAQGLGSQRVAPSFNTLGF